MAKAKKNQKDMAHWKPGSEPEQAGDVAAKGDFGVPVEGRSRVDRDYASQNTLASDPGKSQPLAWEEDGVRDHGAGARASGPGSSSGGDLDTDIVGVGSGGAGISESGPDENIGAADANASPSSHKTKAKAKLPAKRTSRTTPSASNPDETDITTSGGARGADAATNPIARGDDSFAGEISRGEARGEDLPLPPVGADQGDHDGTEYRDDGEDVE